MDVGGNEQLPGFRVYLVVHAMQPKRQGTLQGRTKSNGTGYGQERQYTMKLLNSSNIMITITSWPLKGGALKREP